MLANSMLDWDNLCMEGRTHYTLELGDRIAELLAEDNSYEQIAKRLGFGTHNLIRWLGKEDDLVLKCMRARLTQADVIDAKMAKISEDLQNGILEPDVARVLLSSMQWRASKKNPKVYGDKTILSNDPDNPIGSLAIRLDSAITQRHNAPIDITPVKTIEHQPISIDGSDLI